MEQAELNIGGTTVRLTKSPSLIAVKPTRGRSAEVETVVARLGAEALPQTLSDFRVVNVLGAAQPMETALDAARADPGVILGSHVYHTSNDNVPFVPTGELYLRFRDTADLEECQSVLDQYALEVVRATAERELTVRVTPDSPNPIKVAAALQGSPVVAVAEPDLATPGMLTAFTLPVDVFLNRQWHLRNTGTVNGSSLGLKAGADARVVAAWEAAETLGSPGVIVAVIDDGFDLNHPDLSGSGKVVAPWDFTRNTANPQPEFNSIYPVFDSQTSQWNGDWHGTACAGVAIGSANGSGILGAAPASRLMPVRWGPNLSNAQVVAWFDYVRLQGAAVVSCSWGAAANVFPLSTPIRDAIHRCATEGRGGRGCVICFAAGNFNHDIQDPTGAFLDGFAVHPDVIAVAACTSRDQRSSYSNFGDAISVCAPSSGAGGLGILTSDVMGSFTRNGQQFESGYSPGAFTEQFGGTSSATPLVAGICALVLSINPTLTAAEVKELLQNTARKIGPPNSYDSDGHSRQFGYGCVDASAAVAALSANPPSPARAATKRLRTARRSTS